MSIMFNKICINEEMLSRYTCLYTNIPSRARCNIQPILSRVYQAWIQSFPSPEAVTISKLKKFSLTYYSPIAGERLVGFIHFPRL